MTTVKAFKVVLTIAGVAMTVLCVGQLQADQITVPNGEFNLYKPGTGYSVTSTSLSGGYAKGYGDDIPVNGGTAIFSDGTTSNRVDFPGWVKIQGVDADLLHNGVGGSVGFNAFAAWGGDVRAETADSLGVIERNTDYTISAMVNQAVADGPLAFYLLADGEPLTPTSSVDQVPPVTDWQQISRTYAATNLSAHVGKSMKIVIGVQDENNLGGRMVFDNIQLEFENVTPAGTQMILY